MTQSRSKEDLFTYYSYTRANRRVIEELADKSGDYLENLDRLDKIRLRCALSSWQMWLEDAGEFLTLAGYLDDDQVCRDFGKWMMLKPDAPALWNVIRLISNGDAEIIDPLLACLSAQLDSGVARR